MDMLSESQIFDLRRFVTLDRVLYQKSNHRRCRLSYGFIW